MNKQIPIIEIKKSSKKILSSEKSDGSKSSLNRIYTIKDMSKSLSAKYGVEFYDLSYDELKEHAVGKASYLLDIACDIKELLIEEDKNRHDKIKLLLECFTKQAHLERFFRKEKSPPEPEPNIKNKKK